MISQSYAQVKERLERELKLDPGINKLAYPAQIYWTPISEEEAFSSWNERQGQTVIYVHIPYCTTKCDFCGFYTQMDSDDRRNRYVSALEREIKLYGERLDTEKMSIEALSIGGGTPSQLTAQEFDRILRVLYETFDTNSLRDAQVEIAPDNYVTEEKLKLLKSKGINRISAGIETWDDGLKRRLRRPRGDIVEENHRVCRLIKNSGFDFNIDLLYGLPCQTLQDVAESLKLSLDYGPDQISFYAISVKPSNGLFRDPDAHRPLEEKLEMYEEGRRILREAGYEQQTRNNFVRNNNTCLYEVRFANGAPTLGVGTTAVSFVESLAYRNRRIQEQYIHQIENGKLPVQVAYRYRPEERVNAFIIKNLEWLKVNIMEVGNRFGVDVRKTHGEALEALEDFGLIEFDDEELRVTDRGIFFITAIKHCFYDAEYVTKREEYYRQKTVSLHSAPPSN